MHIRWNTRTTPIDLSVVSTNELRNIIPQVETILHDMRHDIRHRRFGIIVGEDTSGRVLTLLLAGAINAHYLANGQPKLPVVFLQGTKNKYEFSQQITALKRLAPSFAKVAKGKRALVVSDLVTSEGHTTAQIGQAIHERYGTRFDVAALSFQPDPDMPRYKIRMKAKNWPTGVRFYHGTDGYLALSTIWHREDISGLTRFPKFKRHNRLVTNMNIALRVRKDITALVVQLQNTLQ